jgi:hypothetical protein
MVLRTPIVLVALCLVASAAGRPPPGPNDLRWVKPQPPLATWQVAVPASGTSVLWYPPAMKPTPGDNYSVTTELRNKKGDTILVFLNAGPKTGNERMDNWPSFRLNHLRIEGNHAVRKDAEASGLPFHGGTGRCLIDDYVTHHAGHHYKEITCFVRGKTTASVIVAAALESAWPKYGAWLERAVNAWEVR